MHDFLTEADCAPNINTVVLAGKVIKREELKGKSVGIVFTVGYQKHWPSGGVQEIRIRYYVSGQERIEKLSWLQVGEVVLVKGEVTDKGSVYVLQTEQLSNPEREPGDDDEYLAGVQKYGRR